MNLTVFLAAIVVWAVFHHQRRRHSIELKAECARQSLEWSDTAPKVPPLESVLTVFVGVVSAVGSGAVLVAVFGDGSPQVWGTVGEFAMAGLALGAALVALGVRALAVHWKTPPGLIRS